MIDKSTPISARRLVVCTLLCTGLLSSCNQVGQVVKDSLHKPEIAYQSMSVGNLDSKGLELRPVFEVTNKNRFSVPIDHLSYDLSFNQKKMISGQSSKLGSLPARGKKAITLGLMINQQVFEAFRELLVNNHQLDYRMEGEVSLLGFNIPFLHEDTIYRPQMSFGEIRIQSSSFSKLAFVVSIDINNPNDFAIPLSDVSYRLESAGSALFSGQIESTRIVQGNNRIQIPVTIRLDKIYSNIASLLQNPDLAISLSIDTPLQSMTKNHRFDLMQLLSQ